MHNVVFMLYFGGLHSEVHFGSHSGKAVSLSPRFCVTKTWQGDENLFFSDWVVRDFRASHPTKLIADFKLHSRFFFWPLTEPVKSPIISGQQEELSIIN
jgi:hypothetical protein